MTVVIVKRENFNHELISNGKVNAREIADLYFQTGEVIGQIYVKNGEKVRKGDKIAELNKFTLINKMQQAKTTLENARLEMQDVLIGQGYKIEDMENVPSSIGEMAGIKSGYDQSKTLYELALYELENATLIAPFEGIISNLFTKPHNIASVSEPFCTVIDHRNMEIDFTVLENELPLIKLQDKVVVTPLATSGNYYEGRITEINPLVDENGMVKIKATLHNTSGLFTGMNVRVSVQREVSNQLVIPKSAVVLRSGKQVVFTHKDGKALWNYVKTGFENAGYYTVTEGLEEGDQVIDSGNINLAHEASVILLPK